MVVCRFILSRFIFFHIVPIHTVPTHTAHPKKKSALPNITPFLFFKIMASPNPKSPSYFFVKSEASMSWDSMNRDNMKKYESRQYELGNSPYYHTISY